MNKIKNLDRLPAGNYTFGKDANDERPMVSVVLHTETYETSEPDPTDSWDRANTCTMLTGYSVYADEEHKPVGYWRNTTFPVREEVLPGDEVFLVVVHYSTGDTFGHDDGHVACVGVELESWRAEALRSATLSNKDGWSFEYDGWAYNASAWSGYFEHIEYVEIIKTVVRRP